MAVPNDARQQPGRAHVGARESDLGKEERNLRRLGGHPNVAGSGDDGSRAGDGAVERADDRPAAAPHGENEVAGEARELLQRREVLAEQRPDDVLDVAA